MIISSTAPPFSLSINDLIWSCSGPRPERGESDPPSTWYIPVYVRVFSMAMMLCASSTTQIVFLLRVGPTQKKHGSESVLLLQIEHAWIFYLAMRCAFAKIRVCSV